MHSTTSSRRLVATLSVAALLFTGAACSAEGDDASSSTTAAGDVSTTDGGGETTTTESSGDPIDPAELEALLPSEDDLPSGYVRQPDDTSDDSDDDMSEFEDACPDLTAIREALGIGDDASDDEVSRSFKTDADQEIEVAVRSANDRDVPVDDVIDAFNACDTIETDANGYPATVEIGAEALDLGDDGFTIHMDMTLDVEGQQVEINFGGSYFRRDGIAVDVTASSGLDADLSTVPGDFDVAEQLAADIDDAIQSR